MEKDKPVRIGICGADIIGNKNVGGKMEDEEADFCYSPECSYLIHQVFTPHTPHTMNRVTHDESCNYKS